MSDKRQEGMGWEVVYPQNAPELIYASVLKRVLRGIFRTKMRLIYLKNEPVAETDIFSYEWYRKRLVLEQRKKGNYPTHIFTKNSRQAKLSRVVHQSVDVILQHFEVQVHNIYDVLSLLFSFYPTNFE